MYTVSTEDFSLSQEEQQKEIQLEFRGKPLNPAFISTFLWVFCCTTLGIKDLCEAAHHFGSAERKDWDDCNIQDAGKGSIRNIPVRVLLQKDSQLQDTP